MTGTGRLFCELNFKDTADDVFAFYTTRHGGVSKGSYGEMNCTHYCGDNMADVSRNRELLLEALPCRVDRLVIPYQTHGNNILVIDRTFLQKSEEQQDISLYGVDALISSLHNVCLCVSTADCVPVLIYSPQGFIAAVHAGWRGTVSGITALTVEKMKSIFGCDVSELKAIIGPSISVDSFEVGDEVYDAFDAAGFDMDSVAVRNRLMGKWHINLWEANIELMLQSGLKGENILCTGICTWKNYEDLFSARRLGKDSGRILSGIVLK